VPDAAIVQGFEKKLAFRVLVGPIIMIVVAGSGNKNLSTYSDA
jgi:hypothetical protein